MTILNHGDNGTYITNYNWDYNWDIFWMHGGDDAVYAPNNVYKNLLFYGDGGNDVFFSGNGNDTIYGGADNDRLYGSNGGDHITGGLGADTLYGGNDRAIDYFHYVKGDSPSTNGQADTIVDWNRSHMNIDTNITGNSQNFGTLGVNNIFFSGVDWARYLVESDATLRTKDHVFVYDGKNGYLLSDLDRNYSFETGVVLTGAGHAGDVGWNDLV